MSLLNAFSTTLLALLTLGGISSTCTTTTLLVIATPVAPRAGGPTGMENLHTAVSKRMDLLSDIDTEHTKLLRLRAATLSDSAHKQLLHNRRATEGVHNIMRRQNIGGSGLGASPVPPDPANVRRINSAAEYFRCPDDLPGLSLYKARYDDFFVYTGCLWVTEDTDLPVLCNYDAITGTFKDSQTPDRANLCIQQLPTPQVATRNCYTTCVGARFIDSSILQQTTDNTDDILCASEDNSDCHFSMTDGHFLFASPEDFNCNSISVVKGKCVAP